MKNMWIQYKDEQALYDLVNEISLEYFQHPFKHTVRLNHRLRTTGGRYLPSQHMIELNPKYFEEMDREEVIGIIKHELCHYHLHIQGKGYRHGDKDFKQLLKETNSPRYCKPLPSAFNKISYFYVCERCGYQYKRRRRVNTEKYVCGKCKGSIKKYQG